MYTSKIVRFYMKIMRNRGYVL